MSLLIAGTIAELQRAMELLFLLSAVVESSDDAIFTKTLTGEITSWNNGAQRIYGYEPHEVIGQSVAMLVPEDHPDEVPRILERVSRGDKIDHFETVRVRKDGKHINVSLSISSVRDTTGRITGAATIAREVTERIELEQARAALEVQQRRSAIDAERARLEGIAMTARDLLHVINNHLSLPVGMLELLSLRSDIPSSAMEMMRDAAQALEHITEHVRQLQTVVRVEVKQTSLGPTLDLERSIN